MRRPRPKIINWFSFNQHRKRFGAKKVSQSLQHADYATLKTSLIAGDSPVMTYGSKKNIQHHIDDLRDEFIGQSELCYYHARLIVLIRRQVDVGKHFAEFLALWEAEQPFLQQHLSTRWLIAAADTFIDCSDDDLLKALLMNAVVMVNTIKLQESERYLQKSESLPIDDSRRHSLQSERLALFDGVSGFAVGTDDTLRNMRWRLDKLCAKHPLGALVIEVFERLQQDGNVYARFKAMHSREKTAWWTTDD